MKRAVQVLSVAILAKNLHQKHRLLHTGPIVSCHPCQHKGRSQQNPGSLIKQTKGKKINFPKDAFRSTLSRGYTVELYVHY